MIRSAASRGLVLAAILLLLPGPVGLAAEDLMTARELAAKGLKAFEGQTIVFEGRYQICWAGEYIKLVDADLKCFLEPGRPLARQLNNDKDEDGRKLERKTSNLRLEGTVGPNRGRFKGAGEGLVLVLSSVRKLKDDVPRFEARRDALLEAEPKNWQALHELADQARARAEKFDVEALAGWARGLDRQALKLRESLTPEDAVKARRALAESWVEKVGDKDHAIELLNALYEASSDETLRGELTARLQALDAFRSQGRWIPEREFRRAKGYVRREQDGRQVWLRAEKAEFEAAIAEQMKAGQITPVSDKLLQRAAEQGDISVGMRPVHVVSLKLGGKTLSFPTFTDRVRRQVGKSVVVFDQWIYPNSRRMYFADGRLFKFLDSETPLPAK